MAQQTNDNINLQAPKIIDARSAKFVSGAYVPYSSILEANSTVNILYRSRFLSVFILVDGLVKEYWWKDGVADIQLVEKNDLSILTANNGVKKNAFNFELGDPIIKNTEIKIEEGFNLTFSTDSVSNYQQINQKEIIIFNSSNGDHLSNFRSAGTFLYLLQFSKAEELEGINNNEGFFSRSIIKTTFDNSETSNSGTILLGIHYPISSNQDLYPEPPVSAEQTAYIFLNQDGNDADKSHIDYFAFQHKFNGKVYFVDNVGFGDVSETGFKAKVTGDLKVTGKIVSTPQDLTYAVTTTWNLSNGLNANLTLTGNTTLSVTNPIAGIYGTLKVKQDATGNRTLVLPAGSKVKGGGAGAVTLSTTANAVDLLCFYYDGTNYWWTIGKNYT